MLNVLVICILVNAVSTFGSGDAAPGSGSYRDNPENKPRPLERLDELKLKRLVNIRHGRALLISVWATWCAPCVEEFPDIVRIANEMKDQKIDFVGVNADDFGDETSKVMPFITGQKASYKFYIAKLEGEDTFIDAFDKKWGGGIPATFIYDSQGHKKVFLLGKQSYQSLKAAIQRVVGN
jgi:thiol-disulfide isomerase/thioredoxin